MGAARQIDLTYLNGLDVEQLALTDDEIIAAVESALAAQGRGETVVEPRVHLVGFGPSQSTVGANRAGREAVTTLLKRELISARG